MQKIQLENKAMKVVIRILIILFLGGGLIMGTYFAVRANGAYKLKNNATSNTPNLMSEIIKEDEKKQWKEGWIRHKGEVYAYNEDIRTFLVMGTDKKDKVVAMEEGVDGGQADAIFLIVLNPHLEEITLIAVNRDTMTAIEVYSYFGAYVDTITAQLALQHAYGNGTNVSADYMVKAVTNLFYNLPIHGYCALSLDSIEIINDAVGGVEIRVLEDMSKKDKNLVEGETVRLMGKTAYTYIKDRDTSIFDSNGLRLQRQKQYISAFLPQAKAQFRQNIKLPVELFQAVSDYMTTDISIDEVTYLASLASTYTFHADQMKTIEGTTKIGNKYEEFYVNEDALYQLIIDVFYEKIEA